MNGMKPKIRYELRRQSADRTATVKEWHDTERHAVLAFAEYLAYRLTARHEEVGEYWAVVDTHTDQVIIDYAVGANT